MIRNDRYQYRVTWSDQDNEYIGLCSEFPSLSWLAAEPEGALQGIRKLVADVIIDLRANDEIVPEPITDRKFSGRFMVRVAPELHRRLTLEASEAKVSLNRLVNDKLSRSR